MEREIENALNHGQEEEVLSHAFKLKITRGDIQTLRNYQWLNDVVKMRFSILAETCLLILSLLTFLLIADL